MENETINQKLDSIICEYSNAITKLNTDYLSLDEVRELKSKIENHKYLINQVYSLFEEVYSGKFKMNRARETTNRVIKDIVESINK